MQSTAAEQLKDWEYQADSYILQHWCDAMSWDQKGKLLRVISDEIFPAQDPSHGGQEMKTYKSANVYATCAILFT